MKNQEVMLSGPRCSVTLQDASQTDVTNVIKAFSLLGIKCIGLADREIRAYVDSALESLSGDGYDFQWELDFNSAVD